MPLAMNRDVFITCAVTGSGGTQDRSPHVPRSPEQIATSAIEAAKAGAAVVHCHVRDPETGKPSRDPALYREVTERIRDSGTDVVLNLTAGMGGDLMFDGTENMGRMAAHSDMAGAEERVAHVVECRPEICTLDCGTMNFNEADYVMVNTPGMLPVSYTHLGLEFRALDVPLYHADARAWEVTRGGRHIAVFIGDYFARGSKRSGAWCSAMRSQRKLGGEVRPIVVNICNFAKGDPALLSYDDARTLFHEFGHALHQMLSDVTYGFISGTSVARDFVELPSQLYEHWLEVPEVLEKHARHVVTLSLIHI